MALASLSKEARSIEQGSMPRLSRGMAWIVVRYALLALSALLLATACSSGRPAAPASTAPSASTVTITQYAVASVLITSQEEASRDHIQSIQVFPRSVVVDQREFVDLSARAFDVEGRTLEDVDFIWTVLDPRAGFLTRDGGFRSGGAPGLFTDAISVVGVQNTPGGVRHATATVSVTVVGDEVPPTLASVAILPGDVTVLFGQLYRLRAIGYDESGLVIPGVSFVWQVTEPALGHVNDIGYLAVEGQPGIFREAVKVTGIWDGATISESINVSIVEARSYGDFLNVRILPQRFSLDPQGRLQVRAVALNGLGELITGTQLRWSMADPSAGTIDGSGMFAAGAEHGVFTEAIKVEAVVPGEQGIVRAVDFASVIIRQPQSTRRLETVRVQLDSVVLGPGERTLMLARGVDELGQPAESVEIKWRSDNELAGTIHENGTFTAGMTPGIYPKALLVTARQASGEEELARTTSVDVIVTGALARIEVRPRLATISAGRTNHFSITGWDENDIVLSNLVVRWSVADERVGTIDVFGNFTSGDVPGLYEDAISVEVIQTMPNQR